MSKKLKIGIYGDSYAISGDDITQCWGHHLRKYFDVYIHGRPASSVEWSVQQFINTYKDYDKIVFVVTEANRIYLPKHPGLPHWTVHTHNSVKGLHRSMRGEYENYIRFHMKYAYDESVLVTKQKAYLNFVLNLKPDTLFLSSFPNCIPDDQNISLSMISDLDHINSKSNNYLQNIFATNNPDPRPCHMNHTNNLLLARKIKQWIDTGKFDLKNTDDFYIPLSRSDLFTINKKLK